MLGQVLIAASDAEAEAILRTAKCRYLLTSNLRAVLPAYGRAVGRPGIDLESTFAVRVHESPNERPVPFLLRVLDSRSGRQLSNGRWIPGFRIYRVLDPSEQYGSRTAR